MIVGTEMWNWIVFRQSQNPSHRRQIGAILWIWIDASPGLRQSRLIDGNLIDGILIDGKLIDDNPIDGKPIVHIRFSPVLQAQGRQLA